MNKMNQNSENEESEAGSASGNVKSMMISSPAARWQQH